MPAWAVAGLGLLAAGVWRLVKWLCDQIEAEL